MNFSGVLSKSILEYSGTFSSFVDFYCELNWIEFQELVHIWTQMMHKNLVYICCNRDQSRNIEMIPQWHILESRLLIQFYNFEPDLDHTRLTNISLFTFSSGNFVCVKPQNNLLEVPTNWTALMMKYDTLSFHSNMLNATLARIKSIWHTECSKRTINITIW